METRRGRGTGAMGGGEEWIVKGGEEQGKITEQATTRKGKR